MKESKGQCLPKVVRGEKTFVAESREPRVAGPLPRPHEEHGLIRHQEGAVRSAEAPAGSPSAGGGHQGQGHGVQAAPFS